MLVIKLKSFYLKIWIERIRWPARSPDLDPIGNIINKMALYRFFTGTAVSAKIQKHAVFAETAVPVKNRYKAILFIISGDS